MRTRIQLRLIAVCCVFPPMPVQRLEHEFGSLSDSANLRMKLAGAQNSMSYFSDASVPGWVRQFGFMINPVVTIMFVVSLAAIVLAKSESQRVGTLNRWIFQ